jgi:plasmid stabilization system protein ParE
VPAEIRFAESALDDLEGIQAWYAEQGVAEVGVRLVGDLVRRIEYLADHPDMGRMVPEFGQHSLRELIHPPFRIVYRRDSGAVRVVRVWRSERRLRLVDRLEELEDIEDLKRIRHESTRPLSELLAELK